jgi:hypothetical protein
LRLKQEEEKKVRRFSPLQLTHVPP